MGKYVKLWKAVREIWFRNQGKGQSRLYLLESESKIFIKDECENIIIRRAIIDIEYI